MNGIPHVTHLRSFSLFGLSDIKLIFDDEGKRTSEPRTRAGAAFAGHCCRAGVRAADENGLEPGRARSTSSRCTAPIPQYDVMELKSLEDWVMEKNFKAVPNIVDVASFGGPTREYQVRVDPDKLISYGLSIGAGGAAAHQQQRQRRRQLHRGRAAADQRQRSRPGEERSGHRKHGDH